MKRKYNIWYTIIVRRIFVLLYFLFNTILVYTQSESSKIIEYQKECNQVFASQREDSLKLRYLVNHIHDVSSTESELPTLYYKEGKAIANKLNDKYWHGKLDVVLAKLFVEIRDLDQAEKAYLSAIQNFKEADNFNEIINTKMKLAGHYSVNKAKELALAEAYELEEMTKGLGEKRKAEVLTVFASILTSLVKEDEGIEKALQARKIYEKLDMQKELADNYEQTAIAHMRRKRFYKALPDIDTAIAIANRNPDWGYRRHFEFIQNRAQINGDSGDFEKALEDLNYVDKMTRGVDSLDFYFFNSHKIGTYTWRQRDLKKSKAVHLEIINRPDFKYNRWAIDALAYLSMIYEQEERFDSAYYYHMKYHELEGGRNLHESKIQMENLKTQYETEEKEKKIKAQQEQINQVRTIQFLSLTLAGILAILFFQSFRNAKKRKKINSELGTAYELLDKKNQQNEILLKEIHHRVKNNLQTVSSLLYLQSYSIDDEELKGKINISQQRVESMALIHKNLYQKENLSAIELNDYLDKLSENLINAYRTDKDIVILVEMDKHELDVDIAIPLGLIVNELVTNSLKYAFVNRDEGQIKIEFSQIKNLNVLKVSDNGVGKPANVKENFGTQLVTLLTRQIDGRLKEGNDGGHWTEIIF